MFSTIAGRMFGETETPSYEVISKNDVYEERKYASGKWAVTTVEGKNFKDSSSAGFMKLFKYISGTNMTGKNVAMTAPVCFFCLPDDDEWNTMKQVFHVGFFLPVKTAGDPPKPKDDVITFRDNPEATMYVRRFGGYAGEKEIIQELKKLRASLSTDQYKDGCFYFCGYDSPMKPINRTNEIWLIKS